MVFDGPFARYHGERGSIDLGIPITVTVTSVLGSSRQTRRHRVDSLNRIEEKIVKLKQRDNTVEADISLWKANTDKFKRHFTTKCTWETLHSTQPTKIWYGSVWFKYATPKYSFLLWLANQNHLRTRDRMTCWGQGQRIDCVLCNNTEETRDHLFFECSYSSEIWSNLACSFMTTDFSTRWNRIISFINNSNLLPIKLFPCDMCSNQLSINFGGSAMVEDMATHQRRPIGLSTRMFEIV